MRFLYLSQRNQALFPPSIYFSEERKESQEAKPEITQYYNKSKGRMNTIDQMLNKYTVKCETLP